MNIIAPRPKKPSSYNSIWNEEDEACQELRQILASHSNMMEDLAIIRTNNPSPHQAVSQLSVSEVKRPRSFSVGDSRNYPFNNVISLVH
jgi:hypothetical protein